MSLSFMIRRSSPSSLTSLPDHLPNRMRSPTLTSSGLDLAVVVAGAGADGDDFAFLRLFLGGVGNDDPALGLVFFLDAADEDAIAKRTKRHVGSISDFETGAREVAARLAVGTCECQPPPASGPARREYKAWRPPCGEYVGAPTCRRWRRG